MKIKKGNLTLLVDVLKKTDLGLKDARERDAFLLKLNQDIEQFHKDQDKIYRQFARKKEDGELDITKNGNQINYSFDNDKFDEMQKELELFYSETITVKPTENLPKFIEDTTYKPKVGQVEYIDEILKAMRKQLSNSKKKKK